MKLFLIAYGSCGVLMVVASTLWFPWTKGRTQLPAGRWGRVSGAVMQGAVWPVALEAWWILKFEKRGRV